jgi:hypothetical protein
MGNRSSGGMNSGVSHDIVKGEDNGRWEGKRQKQQNAMSTIAPSFIWVAGDGAMIHFPRKKITFCFNRQRDPDADSRSRGVGSSNDFEIHDVLKKELRSNGRTRYQADRHGYLPEVKIEITE